MGSPVGRDARAIQGWSSYWLTPRTRIEFSYRQLKGNPLFLPGGSTQTDGIVKAWIALTAALYLDLDFQLERFRVPVLGPPQHNAGLFVSLRWEPKSPLVHR